MKIIKDNKKIIFIFLIILIILRNNNINYIVGLILIFYLLFNYEYIDPSIKKLNEKKEDNINYTYKIQDIFDELKEYESVSLFDYKKGIEYWKSFIKLLVKLEDKSLYNYNQYYENAYNYLILSVNKFMGLGVAVNELTLIDGLEYNDFSRSKDMKKISKLVKDLYYEGYKLLYSLSFNLNDKWKDNINIYNKPIMLEYPKPRDISSNKHEFFI